MAKSSTSFKPGKSGNPGGRPAVVTEVRELAREHTADAINTLASILNDEKAHATARTGAAVALLDRGYGKATTVVKDERDSIEKQLIELIKSLDDKPKDPLPLDRNDRANLH